MTYFLMAAMYLGLLVVHVRQIIRSNLNKPDFRLGILVGNLFFVVIPLGIGLLNDKIPSPFPVIPDFYPSENISTTIVLFTGWMSVLLFGQIKMADRRSVTSLPAIKISEKSFTMLIFFIYAIFGLISFRMSGLGEEGSHWYRSSHEMFENSTAYVLIRNFSGVYRVAIFGMIYGLWSRRILTTKAAVIWGAVVVVLDMGLSFNRITIVFYAISLMFMFIRYALLQLIGLIVAVPLVGSFSQVWPEFRGTVFLYGFSVENTINAWNRAVYTTQHMQAKEGMAVEAVFESSNLATLNYVVENSGSTLPYSYGATFILRPLIAFMPKTLFPGKPEPFNAMVGYAASGDEGRALNSILYGESFNNFPYVWPVFLVAFLFFFSWVFTKLGRLLPLIEQASFMIGVAVWRFDTNFLSITLYAFALSAVAALILISLRNTILSKKRGGEIIVKRRIDYS